MPKVYISWAVSHDKSSVGWYWGTHQETFTSRYPWQQLIFSTYKNLDTYYALVGTSPSGTIVFVSDLCSGSISGKEFSNQSGVLSLLERGDAVMGDQVFDIQDDWTPLGVKLNMPLYLKRKSQLSRNQIIETWRIASAQIHAELAMERIKKCHFYDRVYCHHFWVT